MRGSEDVGHIDICVKRSGQNVVITVTDDSARHLRGKRLRKIRRELAGNRTRENISASAMSIRRECGCVTGGVRRDSGKHLRRIYPGGDNASG
ncbi:MAG: hypothetical protein ACLR7N_12310 [Roseburia hominis]